MLFAFALVTYCGLRSSCSFPLTVIVILSPQRPGPGRGTGRSRFVTVYIRGKYNVQNEHEKSKDYCLIVKIITLRINMASSSAADFFYPQKPAFKLLAGLSIAKNAETKA
jgi:hypothetical protein